MFPGGFRHKFDSKKASVTSDADVLAAISVSNFLDGQAVLLQAVFGNSLTYDDATGGAVSARICMQVCTSGRGQREEGSREQRETETERQRCRERGREAERERQRGIRRGGARVP